MTKEELFRQDRSTAYDLMTDVNGTGWQYDPLLWGQYLSLCQQAASLRGVEHLANPHQPPPVKDEYRRDVILTARQPVEQTLSERAVHFGCPPPVEPKYRREEVWVRSECSGRQVDRRVPDRAEKNGADELSAAGHSWVYVITNRARPLHVKISFTSKDPDKRVKALDRDGPEGSSHVVAYKASLENPRRVKHGARERLIYIKTSDEWFACETEMAIAAIRMSARYCKYPIVEQFLHADRVKADKFEAVMVVEEDAIERAEHWKDQRRRIAEKYEALVREKSRFEFGPLELSLFGLLSFVTIGALSPKMGAPGKWLIAVCGACCIAWVINALRSNEFERSSERQKILSDRDTEFATVDKELAKLRGLVSPRRQHLV